MTPWRRLPTKLDFGLVYVQNGVRVCVRVKSSTAEKHWNEEETTNQKLFPSGLVLCGELFYKDSIPARELYLLEYNLAAQCVRKSYRLFEFTFRFPVRCRCSKLVLLWTTSASTHALQKRL